MTSKISMLQRQMAFQRAAINNEHKLVKVCKDQIKWLKGVPDIACTQKRIDVLYKCVEASKKKIAKLVEMQKFTKGQLQEAYFTPTCTDFVVGTMREMGEWKTPTASFEFVGYGSTSAHDWYPDQHGPRPDRAVLPSVVAAYLTGFDAGNYGGMPDHNCWEAPGGLRNEYKHNPKFMECAPAAEVGSAVGDEL